MNHESLELVERQLADLHPRGAPVELRGRVLAAAGRELRAARWDRRLARAAVGLLIVGIGLNAALVVRSSRMNDHQRVHSAHLDSRQSLMDTAIVLAETTDAATAGLFARQLAEMSGRELTEDEAAAIDAAVKRALRHSTRNRNKG